MNQVVFGGLTGIASGALYGAIGAAAGRGEKSPVLKGAVTAGSIGGVLATVTWALITSRQADQKLQELQAAQPAEIPAGQTAGVYFP